ncbi:helix-turn-helix transcriptional regulator [Brevibacillus sp. SYP-B805]|uniref:ArsR/SmtB family transcription factor n=1 Tax=Brevibacillus sp. SYP-B805 TaxID=1578199 RepID=UPI0013EA6624|nr:metalloregulator ArsR/SmtB family transcription factor [Brevibacillus sp. SYP-B805]NGQ96626.1 helix-turn-helix transcriptional regulator [Brevibacillus sp. SYP-B805]
MSTDADRLQELFRALGDATRRTILDLLAQHGPMTVTRLADHFPHLVRSGISKHLMELRRLQLVHDNKRGRERYYRINAETISQLLRPWVAKYEKYWDDRLHNLKQAAEEQANTKKEDRP